MSSIRASVRLLTGAMSRKGVATAAVCAFMTLIPGWPVLAQTPMPQTPTFEKPVVVELFTSHGCTSCPPADKLLAQIAHQPNVIAFSLPVDYWDYLGWKDTFASSGHTAKQKGYSKTISGSHVYTPQAIVNGVAQVIGSDSAALAKAANYAYGKHGALTVPLSVKTVGDNLVIEVGAGGGNANLNLIQVASSRSVDVGRGENTGHKLIYTNVGRGIVRLGEWSGSAKRYEIALSQVRSDDTDGWIVVLQSGEPGKPGAILAAAKSPNI
jgi:hypothetical protein